MSEFNGKIDGRLTEVKATFEELEQEKKSLNEQRTGLVNQVSTLDRRINEIKTTQFGLNERYNELFALLPEEERAKYLPKPTPPAVTKTEQKEPKKTTVKKRLEN